jgi:hypothetical protein
VFQNETKEPPALSIKAQVQSTNNPSSNSRKTPAKKIQK